ncbi:MAG TPA: hypothetical protein VGA78_05465 [Gemmatimonadales bacterium]
MSGLWQWKRSGAMRVLIVGGVIMMTCRPAPPPVPAGPATQPAQGSGEDEDDDIPPVPDKLNITPDTTLIVARPDSGDVYYRTLLSIAFDDTTSGITVKKVLYQYKGTIVGGYPKLGPKGTYVVQVEDRGPRWPRLAALVDSIRAEKGVFSAAPTAFRAKTNERDSL